jgi:transcriptional regulator with XRE-family HTH domain
MRQDPSLADFVAARGGRGSGGSPAVLAFGRAARGVRIARGLARADLAGWVAELTVMSLEHGERDPRLSTVLRLARGLRVRPAELLAVYEAELEAGASDGVTVIHIPLASLTAESDRVDEAAWLATMSRFLRAARRAGDVKQEDLARRTGFGPRHISGLESAPRDLWLTTILRLARGLGVTAREAFAIYDAPTAGALGPSV